MAAIGAGSLFSIIGTAVSVAGTLQQASAASAQSKSQASIASYNAQVAKNNALAARQAAEVEAQEAREESRRRLGVARGKQAASGIVTTEGSALLTQQEIVEEGELEAARRIFSGETQARGFESQSRLDAAQSQIFRQRAGSQKQEGFLSAGSKILTGISTLK